MPSFNPIIVEGYAALFSCTAVVQALDEKSNLQIPSNLLQRFGTAAVCIVLLIFISGLYDFTLHLQIRKYDGLTYCGRIAKIITTAF